MSTPEGGSRAPYIIICNGRIELGVAHNSLGRIQAASRTATALVAYFGERLRGEDARPISALQHEMMDIAAGKGLREGRSHPDELADEMFTLLDGLESAMRLRN